MVSSNEFEQVADKKKKNKNMGDQNTQLRRERQLRGWSQVYMAEQLGTPDYYISRWERGEVLPSPFYQQKLCELFGKTAEELGFLLPVK